MTKARDIADRTLDGVDLTFGDNDKAIFGAGSDLEIYHSGTNSFITEQGTGSLYISATNLNMRSTALETYLNAVENGAVSIYYDNALKLATTATGIDVTGTAVTDGLTVAGNVSVDGGTIKLDGNYPVGTSNVALGDAALNASVTGGYSTAVGHQALTAMTSGNGNVGIGFAAGDAITSGSANVAVGTQALSSNTTASNNTAVGYQALYSNTTGIRNVAIGDIAGNGLTSGSENVLIGRNSGDGLTTSSNNTFVGDSSGYLVTTGTRNTIIGRYSGNSGGLDIRTASNYIVLSNGDGTPRGHFDNIGNWCVGGPYANPPSTYSFAQMTRTGILQSGRTGTGNQPAAEFFNGNGVVGSIYTNGSSTSFNTSSDYRLKENVVELTGATDRLKQIPVHRFNFTTDPDTTVDGFLAHEVQAIVPEAITGEHNEVDTDGNPVYQGIDQSKLVPLLVATIKELEARIAALEAN